MGVRGEVFSTKVSLQNRTYFFNVKENRLGDLYLNIVESRNRDEGGFERQSVILFAEDLQEFLQGFDESLRVMEKEVREKKRGKSAGAPPRRDRETGFREGAKTRSKAPWDKAPWDKAPRDTSSRDRGPRDGNSRDRGPRESNSRDRGPKTAQRERKPRSPGPGFFDSFEERGGERRTPGTEGRKSRQGDRDFKPRFDKHPGPARSPGRERPTRERSGPKRERPARERPGKDAAPRKRKVVVRKP